MWLHIVVSLQFSLLCTAFITMDSCHEKFINPYLRNSYHHAQITRSSICKAQHDWLAKNLNISLTNPDPLSLDCPLFDWSQRNWTLKEKEMAVNHMAQTQRARKEIEDFVARVDLVQYMATDASYHFESDRSLRHSNELLQSFRTKVVSLLRDGDHREAREQLGYALHIVQDFYSHTNWVEEFGAQNDIFEELGKDMDQVEFDKIFAGSEVKTCMDCKGELNATEQEQLTAFIGGMKEGDNPIWTPNFQASNVKVCRDNLLKTDTIATGYNGWSSVNKDQGKCSAGGGIDFMASSSPVGGIAKDSASFLFSPHYYLHETAAQLAYKASLAFIEQIEAEVGIAAFGNLLGIGTPHAVVIVYDHLENMYATKEVIISWAESHAISALNKVLFGVALFYDGSNGVYNETSDMKTFASFFNNIAHKTTKENSSDSAYEEKGVFDAIVYALNRCPFGAQIAVLTNANTKNADLLPTILALAHEKHVTISFINKESSHCGTVPHENLAGCSVYSLIAKITGGVFVSVPTVKAVAEAMETVETQQSMAYLLREKVIPSPNYSGEWSFFVDSSVDNIEIIFGSTSQVDMTKLTVFDPKGRQQAINDTHTKSNFKALMSTNSMIGQWVVKIDKGFYPKNEPATQVIVRGSDALGWSYEITEAVKRGRWPGLLAIEGLPVAGGKYFFSIECMQCKTVDILKLTSESTIIETNPVHCAGNKFIVEVILPQTSYPFSVEVFGRNLKNEIFHRISVRKIPVSVIGLKVGDNASAALVAEEMRTIPFEINNFRINETYSIKVTSDQEWLLDWSPKTITIADDGIIFGNIEVPERENKMKNAFATVRLTVASQTDSYNWNSKSLRLALSANTVQKNSPTDVAIALAPSISLPLIQTVAQNKDDSSMNLFDVQIATRGEAVYLKTVKEVKIEIRNLGKADEFLIEMWDSYNWISSLTPKSVLLATNQTEVVTALLYVKNYRTSSIYSRDRSIFNLTIASKTDQRNCISKIFSQVLQLDTSPPQYNITQQNFTQCEKEMESKDRASCKNVHWLATVTVWDLESGIGTIDWNTTGADMNLPERSSDLNYPIEILIHMHLSGDCCVKTVNLQVTDKQGQTIDISLAEMKLGLIINNRGPLVYVNVLKEITAEIRNNFADDNFTVSVSDDNKWLVRYDPKEVKLAQNEAATIYIFLYYSGITIEDTTVRVTVESKRNSTISATKSIKQSMSIDLKAPEFQVNQENISSCSVAVANESETKCGQSFWTADISLWDDESGIESIDWVKTGGFMSHPVGDGDADFPPDKVFKLSLSGDCCVETVLITVKDRASLSTFVKLARRFSASLGNTSTSKPPTFVIRAIPDGQATYLDVMKIIFIDITNYGPPDDFLVDIRDDRGWKLLYEPQKLLLSTDDSDLIVCYIKGYGAIGESSEFVVTVHTASDFRNSATETFTQTLAIDTTPTRYRIDYEDWSACKAFKKNACGKHMWYIFLSMWDYESGIKIIKHSSKGGHVLPPQSIGDRRYPPDYIFRQQYSGDCCVDTLQVQLTNNQRLDAFINFPQNSIMNASNSSSTIELNIFNPTGMDALYANERKPIRAQVIYFGEDTAQFDVEVTDTRQWVLKYTPKTVSLSTGEMAVIDIDLFGNGESGDASEVQVTLTEQNEPKRTVSASSWQIFGRMFPGDDVSFENSSSNASFELITEYQYFIDYDVETTIDVAIKNSGSGEYFVLVTFDEQKWIQNYTDGENVTISEEGVMTFFLFIRGYGTTYIPIIVKGVGEPSALSSAVLVAAPTSSLSTEKRNMFTLVLRGNETENTTLSPTDHTIDPVATTDSIDDDSSDATTKTITQPGITVGHSTYTTDAEYSSIETISGFFTGTAATTENSQTTTKITNYNLAEAIIMRMDGDSFITAGESTQINVTITFDYYKATTFVPVIVIDELSWVSGFCLYSRETLEWCSPNSSHGQIHSLMPGEAKSIAIWLRGYGNFGNSSKVTLTVQVIEDKTYTFVHESKKTLRNTGQRPKTNSVIDVVMPDELFIYSLEVHEDTKMCISNQIDQGQVIRVINQGLVTEKFRITINDEKNWLANTSTMYFREFTKYLASQESFNICIPNFGLGPRKRGDQSTVTVNVTLQSNPFESMTKEGVLTISVLWPPEYKIKKENLTACSKSTNHIGLNCHQQFWQAVVLVWDHNVGLKSVTFNSTGGKLNHPDYRVIAGGYAVKLSGDCCIESATVLSTNKHNLPTEVTISQLWTNHTNPFDVSITDFEEHPESYFNSWPNVEFDVRITNNMQTSGFFYIKMSADRPFWLPYGSTVFLFIKSGETKQLLQSTIDYLWNDDNGESDATHVTVHAAATLITKPSVTIESRASLFLSTANGSNSSSTNSPITTSTSAPHPDIEVSMEAYCLLYGQDAPFTATVTNIGHSEASYYFVVNYLEGEYLTWHLKPTEATLKAGESVTIYGTLRADLHGEAFDSATIAVTVYPVPDETDYGFGHKWGKWKTVELTLTSDTDICYQNSTENDTFTTSSPITTSTSAPHPDIEVSMEAYCLLYGQNAPFTATVTNIGHSEASYYFVVNYLEGEYLAWHLTPTEATLKAGESVTIYGTLRADLDGEAKSSAMIAVTVYPVPDETDYGFGHKWARWQTVKLTLTSDSSDCNSTENGTLKIVPVLSWPLHEDLLYPERKTNFTAYIINGDHDVSVEEYKIIAKDSKNWVKSVNLFSYQDPSTSKLSILVNVTLVGSGQTCETTTMIVEATSKFNSMNSASLTKTFTMAAPLPRYKIKHQNMSQCETAPKNNLPCDKLTWNAVLAIWDFESGIATIDWRTIGAKMNKPERKGDLSFPIRKKFKMRLSGTCCVESVIIDIANRQKRHRSISLYNRVVDSPAKAEDSWMECN